MKVDGLMKSCTFFPYLISQMYLNSSGISDMCDLRRLDYIILIFIMLLVPYSPTITHVLKCHKQRFC